MKKLFVLALLLTAMAGSLTACNTIQGAGQDIKDGGAALDRAISE
jgi:predicted small secreted protein